MVHAQTVEKHYPSSPASLTDPGILHLLDMEGNPVAVPVASYDATKGDSNSDLNQLQIPDPPLPPGRIDWSSASASMLPKEM